MNRAQVAFALAVSVMWAGDGRAAIIDTVSVVLPSIAATTAQGLPNTPLGAFNFTVSTQINPVNNDAVKETVYNLRGDATEQYRTQYYACAARGGGCSTTPTTITVEQTATGFSPQAFVAGEQATARFTFSYMGSLTFNVAATNLAGGETYSLALAASDGTLVKTSDPLNGMYTLSLIDPSFSRSAMYVITTMPADSSGLPGIPANPGGSGNGSPGSGTSGPVSQPGQTDTEGGISSTSVPEPSSAVLLSMTLFLCAVARQYRTR